MLLTGFSRRSFLRFFGGIHHPIRPFFQLLEVPLAFRASIVGVFDFLLQSAIGAMQLLETVDDSFEVLIDDMFVEDTLHLDR